MEVAVMAAAEPIRSPRADLDGEPVPIRIEPIRLPETSPAETPAPPAPVPA
jgi:hypothetical protein